MPLELSSIPRTRAEGLELAIVRAHNKKIGAVEVAHSANRRFGRWLNKRRI